MGVNPEDDLVHPDAENVDDANWRESYYVDCYDPKLGFGLWQSIQHKVSTGDAAFSVCLWGNRNYVVSGIDRVQEYNNDHRVKGLRFTCEEPMGAWSLSYEGKLLPSKRPKVRMDTSLANLARQRSQTVPVTCDLTWRPTHPPYVTKEQAEWAPYFAGEVNQFGQLEGTVRIGEEEHSLQAPSFKRHRWGVRNRFQADGWRSLTSVREEGPRVYVRQYEQDDDRRTGGVVMQGEEDQRVLDLDVELFTANAGDPKPVPLACRASLQLRDGEELELTGRVLKIHPVLYQRHRDQVEELAWTDRSLMEWYDSEGALGFGTAEFGEIVEYEPEQPGPSPGRPEGRQGPQRP